MDLELLLHACSNNPGQFFLLFFFFYFTCYRLFLPPFPPVYLSEYTLACMQKCILCTRLHAQALHHTIAHTRSAAPVFLLLIGLAVFWNALCEARSYETHCEICTIVLFNHRCWHSQPFPLIWLNRKVFFFFFFICTYYRDNVLIIN